MKENEYKCSNCGKVFKKGWTDEESKKEYFKNFGTDLKDTEIVCEFCYIELLFMTDPFNTLKEQSHIIKTFEKDNIYRIMLENLI